MSPVATGAVWLSKVFAAGCLLAMLAACGGAAKSTPAMASDATQAQSGYGYEFAEGSGMPVPTEAPRMASSLGRSTGNQQPAATAEAPPSPPPSDGSHDGGQSGVAATQAPQPLLIYQATLALAVYEVQKGLDRVEDIAKQAGGYLVSRRGNVIVVRVPAKGFDASLRSVLGLGDVLQRDLQVEDVTARVRDLEARLKNAEAVRQRLTELVRAADKVEGALAVERELARVTEDIERMKAELRSLSELVAFSTITTRFEAPHVEQLDKRFRLPFQWLEELGLSNLLQL